MAQCECSSGGNGSNTGYPSNTKHGRVCGPTLDDYFPFRQAICALPCFLAARQKAKGRRCLNCLQDGWQRLATGVCMRVVRRQESDSSYALVALPYVKTFGYCSRNMHWQSWQFLSSSCGPKVLARALPTT